MASICSRLWAGRWSSEVFIGAPVYHGARGNGTGRVTHHNFGGSIIDRSCRIGVKTAFTTARGPAMSTRPHDALIRDVLTHPEHAKGELQHMLPADLCARLDWATLVLVPGTFVDDALQDSYSDLLFRVQLDGRSTYLY